MNLRKRTGLVLVVVLLVVACVSVWAGGTKEKQVSIAVPTVLGWVTTDGVIPIVADALAKEGIKVVAVPSENVALRDKQMLEGRQGTSAYDVFLAWEALMPLMKDFLEPLDSHVQAQGLDVAAFKKQFYQAVQDQISYDGQMYWVPIHVNSQLGYARADLFNSAAEQAAFKAKYGYDMPKADANGSLTFKDRNQFLDVAMFFTRDTNGNGTVDLWGYDQPGKWDHGNCVFEEQMLRAGLEYFDAKGHSLWGPMHPENQQAIQDIATWDQNTVQKWKVTSPGALGMEMTEVNQLFTEGKAAMSFTWNVDFWGTDSKGAFADKYGKPLSWSIDFVNKSPNDKGIMSIWGYALNKNSKNKDAAVKFLMALSDANLRKKAHETANLPCPNGMVEVTEWAVQQGYAPGAFINAVQTVGSFWPISKKAWPETEQVRDVARKAHEELLSGKITPAEFVKTTGTQIEAIMKGAGYF
jgi:ABC-type glycerol-3-phosphate transport system substrate-binding protein